MNPHGIHLLAISTDTSLLRETGGEVQGDSHQRNLKYARRLAGYHIIVCAEKGDGPTVPQRVEMGPNLWVYPTRASSRAGFVREAARRAGEICRRWPVDLIYTADPFATGLAGHWARRRARRPLLISLAGDMIGNKFWIRARPVNRLLNPLGRWLVRRADGIRVVSSKEREKWVRAGVPPERIHDVGWIMDFAQFQGADGKALRAALLKPPFSRLVLFVGRLVYQKNLPDLARAIARVAREAPETRFVLVGDGPERGRFQEMVRNSGVAGHVELVGAQPHEKIPEYMSAADLLVLPSWYEGNARVLAEAALTGLPAVATDVSGARDTVIHGETGWVVSPGDPEALAEGVLRLLRDDGLRREMGARGRAHVAALSEEERLLDRFQAMCEETVKRWRGAR